MSELVKKVNHLGIKVGAVIKITTKIVYDYVSNYEKYKLPRFVIAYIF